MMDWRHRANRRNGRRLRLASVEPYLGDVIGAPLAPLRPVYCRDYSPPDWVRRGVCSVVTTFGITVWSVILAAVVLSFFVAASHGHESADWIRRQDFKNTVGELCCGERDCNPIQPARVDVTPWGYRIATDVPLSGNRTVTTHELVPFNEVTPTPPEIGGYWLCRWGGRRKCFFAPPGSA